MDETKLLELIAQGENVAVEFKREIDLATARGKSEFVKDIIAIANSTRETGYMLIGVGDDKSILGLTALGEERIQQVATTYITPAPLLACTIVNVTGTTPAQIGVIEIKPLKRPHKVARSIENVLQNRVFVRHGTVVAEASPEEIVGMGDRSTIASTAREHIRAAETHAQLGNLDNAILAYSAAIILAPTFELFLGRGRVYERRYIMAYDNGSSEAEEHWKSLAFKDYSDAVNLAASVESERTARVRRWSVYMPSDPRDHDASDQDWQAELDWLRANTAGTDLGEVLYCRIRCYSDNAGISAVENAAAELSKIIELGYAKPEVYALRAEAHFYSYNYGLALRDIDTALKAPSLGTRAIADYYYLRANILSRMGGLHEPYEGPFVEAYDCLKRAERISGEKAFDPNGYIASGIETEILYRCVLDYMSDRDKNEFRVTLVRSLALAFGDIATTHPRVASMIREMVGESFWKRYKDRLE